MPSYSNFNKIEPIFITIINSVIKSFKEKIANNRSYHCVLSHTVDHFRNKFIARVLKLSISNKP